MRTSNRGLLCALCCAFALSSISLTFAQAGVELPPDQSARLASAAPAELPDSPGATLAQNQETSQQNAASQSSNQQNSAPPQAAPEQKPQRPVGTAAAEAPKVSGITAAQPAGVAIAPAKQHRARAIVIKVGAIAGAAVALGAVVALTAATPSKPPGAH